MATATVQTTLPNGHRIHLRKTQMLLWGIVAGVLGASFVAGLYYGILQANWHIFWLKPWWDGLFHGASWWPVYRHTAFRDIPEPAFAVMGIMTLLAKPKYWDKKVSTIRLVTTPFVLIVLTFALGIAGTWLLNFGLPEHARSVLAWHSVGNLLLGFAIAHGLRFLWAPVGATFQGHLIEAQVNKASAKGRVPLWVRWPLSPPVIRQRFSKLYTKRDGVQLYDKTDSHRWLVPLMSIVFTLVTALGIAGHYWAGTGHVIPFLSN